MDVSEYDLGKKHSSDTARLTMNLEKSNPGLGVTERLMLELFIHRDNLRKCSSGLRSKTGGATLG